MIVIATGKYTNSYKRKLAEMQENGANNPDGYHYRLATKEVDDSCFESGSGVTCYNPEAVAGALLSMIEKCKDGDTDAAERAKTLIEAALLAYQYERDIYNLFDKNVLRKISGAVDKSINDIIKAAETESAKVDDLPFAGADDSEIEAGLSCARYVKEAIELRRVLDVVDKAISSVDELALDFEDFC